LNIWFIKAMEIVDAGGSLNAAYRVINEAPLSEDDKVQTRKDLFAWYSQREATKQQQTSETPPERLRHEEPAVEPIDRLRRLLRP